MAVNLTGAIVYALILSVTLIGLRLTSFLFTLSHSRSGRVQAHTSLLPLSGEEARSVHVAVQTDDN